VGGLTVSGAFGLVLLIAGTEPTADDVKANAEVQAYCEQMRAVFGSAGIPKASPTPRSAPVPEPQACSGASPP
jgi:hypothetical protein